MGFEHLHVYQAAELMDTLVLKLIDELPKGHGKDVDQLRRASASVGYNIAEAFGSNTLPQKVNHLALARGSADETRAVIRRLINASAVSQSATLRITALCRTIAKMLTAMMRKLDHTPRTAT